MLCYSPLVGGQNGTPVLGLCHFISEKNVVQAPRVFTVNSYIELSRSNWNYLFKPLYSFRGTYFEMPGISLWLCFEEGISGWKWLGSRGSTIFHEDGRNTSIPETKKKQISIKNNCNTGKYLKCNILLFLTTSLIEKSHSTSRGIPMEIWPKQQQRHFFPLL